MCPEDPGSFNLEGAVVSYNPKKPGRPLRAYHAFLMAGTCFVLDVAVAPSNRHRSTSVGPSLWALLERLSREHWPRLVRGDLFWTDTQLGTRVWEFAVLARSLDLEVRSVAQLYRDRADAENGFDELKDQ